MEAEVTARLRALECPGDSSGGTAASQHTEILLLCTDVILAWRCKPPP